MNDQEIARRDAEGAVTDALGAVDRAFSQHRLSDPFDYCPCCKDPAIIERLTNLPLSELTDGDMSYAVGSLLNTLGVDRDVPYFVPRFCRDALGSPGYDVELAFAKLQRAQFREWSANLQAAVDGFLMAQWRLVLLTERSSFLPMDFSDALTVLECMALLGDVRPALDVWTTTRMESADNRILELLYETKTVDGRLRPSMVGGYGETADGYAAILAWLRAEDTDHRIIYALGSLAARDPERAAHLGIRRAEIRLPA